MKTEDLRKMDQAELEKQIGELRKEHFNLRMQQATSQLTQTHRVKAVKRNIAQISTIMREKIGETHG